VARLFIDDCYEEFSLLLLQPLENKISIEHWFERLQQYGHHFPHLGHFAQPRLCLEKDYHATYAYHKELENSIRWFGVIKNTLHIRSNQLLQLSHQGNILAQYFEMVMVKQQSQSTRGARQVLTQALIDQLASPLYQPHPTDKDITEQPKPSDTLSHVAPVVEHYFHLAKADYHPAIHIFNQLNQHFTQAQEKPQCWHEIINLNANLNHTAPITEAQEDQPTPTTTTKPLQKPDQAAA